MHGHLNVKFPKEIAPWLFEDLTEASRTVLTRDC